MVVATLAGMGIDVLDQRDFLGSVDAPSGHARRPRAGPRSGTEIREGFRLAGRLAADGIGQTVVRARGVTVAVEAAEGTDETIRRGGRLAGPGAVVVKAVAARTTTASTSRPSASPRSRPWPRAARPRWPSRRGRVLLVDRDEVVRLADAAGHRRGEHR